MADRSKRYDLLMANGQTLHVTHDAPNLREFCQYLDAHTSPYVPFSHVEDFGSVFVPSPFGEGMAQGDGYRETGWKVINRDQITAIGGPISINQDDHD